jgi:DNA polymerase-3 subunit delta'
VANFLPTVLSRCVVLQMRAVEEAQIAAFLERRQNIAPEQSQVLARFAGGNPGKALQLTEDQAFMELRDRAVDFLAHISSADVMQISEFASGVDQARRDDLLELVLMWYRDILLYHSTRDSNHLIFQEDLQYIIEAADTLSYEQLGAIIDQTDLASRRLKSNVAADAVLEMMFLNIRGQYRNRG